MNKLVVFLSVATLTSISGLAAANAPEPTCVTFQRGVHGTVQDTDLASSNGSWAAGAYPYLWTGGTGHHALVQFDISEIPAAATVVLGKLTVYQQWNSSYTTVDAHQVLAPWAEATASWTNFGNPANWTAGAVGSFNTTDVGYREMDLTTLVAAWVHGDVPNHGVELSEAAGATHAYWASERSNVAQRPSLTVCYVEQVTCASEPCQNGGTCADEGGGYVCTCPSEWIGQNCETPNPCQGGGAYIPDGAGYVCACPIGATGQDCELPWDICTGVTCLNGGTCNPEFGSSIGLCECPAPFFGAYCQYADFCEEGEVYENGACGAPTVCPCANVAGWSQALGTANGVIFDASGNVGEVAFGYVTDPASLPLLSTGLFTPNQSGAFAQYDVDDGACILYSRATEGVAGIDILPSEAALCVAEIQAANTSTPTVPDLPVPFAFLGVGLTGLAAALRNRFARKSGK